MMLGAPHRMRSLGFLLSAYTMDPRAERLTKTWPSGGCCNQSTCPASQSKLCSSDEARGLLLRGGILVHLHVPQTCKQVGKIVWQTRVKLQPLARRRVLKAQCLGMQRRPPKRPNHLFKVARVLRPGHRCRAVFCPPYPHRVAPRCARCHALCAPDTPPYVSSPSSGIPRCLACTLWTKCTRKARMQWQNMQLTCNMTASGLLAMCVLMLPLCRTGSDASALFPASMPSSPPPRPPVAPAPKSDSRPPCPCQNGQHTGTPW